MVIENFQTPEPVRGYAIHGHFRYGELFRKRASSYARSFVRGLPCGHEERATLTADPAQMQRR